MSSALNTPRYTAVGDCGVLVEFAAEVSDIANDAVIALDHAIRSAQLTGVTELVPAFVNLLVVFDPLVTDHQLIEAELRSVMHSSHVAAEGRHHIVPVCYEEQFAPDLAAVAAASGLSVEAVIDAHLGAEFRVAMYGFAPGYAYMSGTPEGNPRAAQTRAGARHRRRQRDHYGSAMSDHDDRDADRMVGHRAVGDAGVATGRGRPVLV